ncbi:MAG: TA system VapC family ribonuclease toxin [Actinomycetota bacterium]
MQAAAPCHQGREPPGCRHRRSQCPLRPDGGTSLIAVDTNILIYAHRAEFPHEHSAASATLKDLAEGPSAWAIPVFVIHEFLRVATHPSILNPPTPLVEAIAVIDQLLQSRSARLLGPGQQYWQLLKEVSVEGEARGNLIFDAAIVAICREHGVSQILTEDRDFERFPGIEILRLPRISSSS